jgi:glycosyltransferase involved in cell wall biosynthesis
MTNLPLVSIGMPVYNGEKFIIDAIESVLQQTFRDYELIISDNCSDDSTQKICAEYCAKYRQIRYYRQLKNFGPHWNFRFVLQNARGAYFTWLASDDLLEPSFLTETVHYIKYNPEVILVSSDFDLIDSAGFSVAVERLVKIRDNIDWGKRRLEFLKYPVSNVFFCIYGLIRTNSCRNVLNFLNNPKKAAGSEIPILARLANIGEIVAIPSVLRKYRRHQASVYMQEVAESKQKGLFAQVAMDLATTYTLRVDQHRVLWSSSLPFFSKLYIAVGLLLFYARHLVVRVLTIAKRTLTSRKARKMAGFHSEK